MTDWRDALNFEQGAANCEIDIKGDWHRDPWGWPENRWAAKSARDVLLERVAAQGVWSSAKIDVAKENYATRRAIVMDPIDRLVYQTLTDCISKSLAAEFKQWVFGWRLERDEPSAGQYVKNAVEWRAYIERLSGMTWFDLALSTDVVSFFASVPVERLCETIQGRARVNKITDRLTDMLRGWSRVQGRAGIPQRSLASALLANMYLASVDQILDKYSPRIEGFGFQRCCRWMDDMWIFGHRLGELRRAQLEIQHALRELDLDMNLAKTDVTERDRLDEKIEAFQHSAIEGDLRSKPQKPESLDALISRVLDEGEHAARTSVRFATVRMRRFGIFRRVEEFVPLAERMPHAADALALLFRNAGTWHDLQEWYLDYIKGDWGSIEWSIAQLGMMFPSDADTLPDKICDYFSEGLTRGGMTVLLPLAAERLAAWRGDKARAIFMEAIRRADTPFSRRAIALAALSVGEEKILVKKWLGQFPETAVTARMLEETNYRPPKVIADFQGAGPGPDDNEAE